MARYTVTNTTGKGVNIFETPDTSKPYDVRLSAGATTTGDIIQNNFLKCTVKNQLGWLPLAGMSVSDSNPPDNPPPPPPVVVSGHTISISGEISQIEVDGVVVWTT